MSQPRYAVGIDLGTTNTALAAADLEAADPAAAVSVFPLPQLVAPGEVTALPLLPSHLYLPSAHELSAGALRLPWGEEDVAVGAFARDQGARVPGRHVASAKSWLCHPSVDRTAAILPWGAPAEVPRLSPVAASARILRHAREAWDAAHPEAPLREQDVIVTVPASFDEGARALTLRAAEQAGLPLLHLLEEPQAAFYDWTRNHRADLAAALGGARLVLVVDVGGGTTDLTLIDARVGPEGPALRRLAVGDHLLLGGDNMDIALARRAEAALGAPSGGVSGASIRLAPQGAPNGSASGASIRLDPAQWGALVQAARTAKELLLSERAPEWTSVAIPGRGSRLVGGALSAGLGRDEARALLLDGFFPRVGRDDAPARAARAGLAELGLPYASDPAVTRHIAAFLRRHERTVEGMAVGGVLYNGGALAPALLADRLTEVIQSWLPPASPPLVRLKNDAPDLAVARGAAYYGLVRRGLGLRIGGGSPRTYFVGVSDDRAVCVVPRGAPEAEEMEVPGRRFGLVLGRPVRFRLFAASQFRPERPGDLVALEGATAAALLELPSLQTVVEGAGTADVGLRAALTEIGTLELWAQADPARRWKLEFQLRGETGDERGLTSALHRNVDQARELVGLVYGKKPQQIAGRDVKDLWRNLEKALGDRAGWSLATSRDLWGVLWACAGKRRRGPDHERLFFALCGFLLRPGFGAPLDAWRAGEAWTLFEPGVQHHQEAAVWAAFWILWRRIAAGLPGQAHRALFEAVAPHLRPPPEKRVGNPPKRTPGLAPDEMVRLLGALERLPVAMKLESGAWLFWRLEHGQPAGALWALGRLGARVPVAGAAQNALPPEEAAAWLERLLALDARAHEDAPFAVAQIARVCGDRARDLDEPLRLRAAAALERAGASPEWSRAVREHVALSEKDEQRVFGESLPPGLHLAG